MTSKCATRTWGKVFLLLIASIALVLGNQRLAHADIRTPGEPRAPQATDVRLHGLGSEIVCEVFTQLNELGEPIPVLDAGDCPNQPPPPAPQCSDAIDNDGDGFIDQQDPNCHLDGDPTNPGSYDPVRNELGTLFACWNGIDDDGDGKIDMNDPGCTSPTDTSEIDPSTPPQCSDGIDNDSDGKIDSADPGCSSPGDTSETDPVTPPDCDDGIDNDGDGKIDMNDPGCTGPTDTSETDPSTPAQCSDGLDNDGDGKIDSADPGCSSPGDNSETDPTTSAECSDLVDNDADTFIDIADPNCHTDGNAANVASYGPGRSESQVLPKCVDGIDNDGDGKIDSADPGCGGSGDDDETDPSSGGNGGNSGGNSGGGGGLVLGIFGVVDGTIGTVLGVATSTPSQQVCDQYLTAFIKRGQKNDPSQVRRLQMVLQEIEGAKIQINGVYDNATFAAVNAFQTKYGADILTPWGLSKPTGFVYLTTRKKINEIFCRSGKEFPLTANELRIIESTVTKSSSTARPGSSTPARPATTVPQSDGKGGPDKGKNVVPTTATTGVNGAVQTAGVDDTQRSIGGFWKKVSDFILGRKGN